MVRLDYSGRLNHFEKNISLSKSAISGSLVTLGLSIEEALSFAAVIISYVLGWSIVVAY